MSGRHASRVAGAYMVLALLWILVSDGVLVLLDVELAGPAAIIKGVAFVLVTGVVLYVAERRSAGQLAATAAEAVRSEQAAQIINEEYERIAGHLSAVLDAMPLPIVALEGDGTVVMWNTAAESTFGWSAQEVIGQTNPIVPAGSRGEYEALIGRALAGEAIRGAEIARLRKDGVMVPLRLHTAPITAEEDGRAVGIVAVFEDVTAERRMRAELADYREHLEDLVEERTTELRETNARLAEATNAKSAFLARLSHDLRTPLNSIIGFTRLLLKEMPGPINDEQRKQLAMVEGAGAHLLELINDVLDLSKIEAGRLELTFADVAVGELAEEIAALMSPLAAEKGLAWQLDVADPDVVLETDRRKVIQILANLLGNAVKFTREGSVGLSVRRDDGDVLFEVTDTGIGVPAEAQERIFQEFEQVSPDDRADGTGLGLAIAQRLAGLLHGSISLNSEPGAGSTFTLRLPLIVPEPDAGAVDTPKPLILTVDDDVDALDSYGYQFGRRGYRVVRALTGAQALERARVLHPDLIMLDIVLPDTDGLEILRALKAEAATADIPVVCASVIRLEHVPEGAEAALVKPLDESSLVSTVEQVLNASDRRQGEGRS
ncbi:MAG: ATP-binding protein [Anaerosomatales bacterium]|nr:ATP-binding protein [Anaerosomatales bacterium]